MLVVEPGALNQAEDGRVVVELAVYLLDFPALLQALPLRLLWELEQPARPQTPIQVGRKEVLLYLA